MKMKIPADDALIKTRVAISCDVHPQYELQTCVTCAVGEGKNGTRVCASK